MRSTRQRVQVSTAPEINDRIAEATRESVAYFRSHKDEIPERLTELDREWDIERAIEANASTLALSGVLLGAVSDRRWLVLPALVSAFLLQHAIQGWCPPVPILRRLGFRTADEINKERYALKALRGDFEGVGRQESTLDRVLAAVGLAPK
ncbi:hypothetical protein [Emcibacter sp. SYSU 3D8]|uniref:hypothetical protein n=1 Tax=Emcibacter sp. SYSU 3D8 TaxID=3133969 RepID=UPI0031FEB480